MDDIPPYYTDFVLQFLHGRMKKFLGSVSVSTWDIDQAIRPNTSPCRMPAELFFPAVRRLVTLDTHEGPQIIAVHGYFDQVINEFPWMITLRRPRPMELWRMILDARPSQYFRLASQQGKPFFVQNPTLHHQSFPKCTNLSVRRLRRRTLRTRSVANVAGIITRAHRRVTGWQSALIL